jgi:small subunit ribosomal protein S1
MVPGDIRKGHGKEHTDFTARSSISTGSTDSCNITVTCPGAVSSHPSELLKVGQEKSMSSFLRHQQGKGTCSLGSSKAGQPVGQHREKYAVARRSRARSSILVPYGAIVDSSRAWKAWFTGGAFLDETHRHTHDVLKQDQEIEAVVSGVNKEEHEDFPRHPAARCQPVGSRPEKLSQGTRVKGKIRNLTSYGAFIELEEGLDGMIHVSDISWTRKINHPSEVLKKGDEVEAVVLEVDKVNQRIAVGVKQLSKIRGRTSTNSTRSVIWSPAMSPSWPASAPSLA